MIASIHELFKAFSGGQFQPVYTGQFQPVKGGQFKSVGGGQFHRFLQQSIKHQFALLIKFCKFFISWIISSNIGGLP
jgi:hypothetical protein